MDMDMDASLPVQPCVYIMLELYTLVLASPGLVSENKTAHHVHASTEGGVQEGLVTGDHPLATALLPGPQSIVLLVFALPLRHAVLAHNPACHFEVCRCVFAWFAGTIGGFVVWAVSLRREVE